MSGILPETPVFLKERRRKSRQEIIESLSLMLPEYEPPQRSDTLEKEEMIATPQVESIPEEIKLAVELPLSLEEAPKEEEVIHLHIELPIELPEEVIIHFQAEAPLTEEVSPPQAIEVIELVQDLDWKTLLKEEGKRPNILLQREWGLLCERIRGLTPETHWSFLWLGENENSRGALNQWRGWLETYICSPLWQCPEAVEVIYVTHQNYPQLTISWEKSDLPPPFLVNLVGWSILPTDDNDRYGFKMNHSGAYISDKTGSA